MMVYVERIAILWIAGWLISSVCFVVAKKTKTKDNDEAFSIKEGLNGIAGLFIGWPIAALMYMVIRSKKKSS